MDETKALGYLIAGTINHAFGSRWGDDDGPQCCTVCCGPCYALAWYRDNLSEAVDVAVKALGGGDGYDWQRPDGGINWDAVGKVWAAPCLNADMHEAIAADELDSAERAR